MTRLSSANYDKIIVPEELVRHYVNLVHKLRLGIFELVKRDLLSVRKELLTDSRWISEVYGSFPIEDLDCHCLSYEGEFG
jgi:hypothetical protein